MNRTMKTTRADMLMMCLLAALVVAVMLGAAYWHLSPDCHTDTECRCTADCLD